MSDRYVPKPRIWWGLLQILVMVLLVIVVAVPNAIYHSLSRDRLYRSRWRELCYWMADHSVTIGQGFAQGFRIMGGLHVR